jgi:hypothetical protein
MLEALVDAWLFRSRSHGPQPEWLTPSDEQEPTPLVGYVVSFIAFHERGFEVPTNRFMRALPHYYGVELHNFNPNSIAQPAIFVVVCEGYLGIEPHWDLWLHLFRVEAFSLSSNVKKVRHAIRAGGCMLLLCSDRAQLYIPATITSSNKVWQSRWFYLRNNDRRLLAYMKRVVFATMKQWGWNFPRELQAQLKPLLDALWRLREHGLTTAGVATVFHRRWVLPLTERRLRLDEMRLNASVESYRMASTALSTDELLWRMKGTVGRTDYTTLVPMRPDQGYIFGEFFGFPFYFRSSPSHLTPSIPFAVGAGLSNRQTPGSGGRG